MTTLESAKEFLKHGGYLDEPESYAKFADQLLAERDAEIERLREALQRILAPSPSMFHDLTVKHLRGIAHNALAEKL